MSNEQKVMSNEQKVTSNEQKVTSNEQKVTSNKQKVTSNEQKVTSNEPKITSNEQKVQPQKFHLTKKYTKNNNFSFQTLDFISREQVTKFRCKKYDPICKHWIIFLFCVFFSTEITAAWANKQVKLDKQSP